MQGFVELQDGRKLEFIDNGLESNKAIVLHHGSPMEMLYFQGLLASLAARGVRAIAYTRPGYGESTRHPGRSVIDNNADLAAVLSHLNISQFVSLGWSAGGPPTLASTLLDGCLGVSVVATPAPFDQPDLDCFAGMTDSFAAECRACSTNIAASFDFKQAHISDVLALTPDLLLTAFSNRPAYAKYEAGYKTMACDLSTSLMRGVSPDAMGFAEDDYSWLKPWGFNVYSINTPVQMWIGDTDEFIPVSHAQWFAKHVRNIDLHILEGQDHISIMVEYVDHILEGALSLLKATALGNDFPN